jgi:hypothetical protein
MTELSVEAHSNWCRVCGGSLPDYVLECAVCEQWWKDNPPPAHVQEMTTEAIEEELNTLGCALRDGEECTPRMWQLEVALRERFGVNAAVEAVLQNND